MPLLVFHQQVLEHLPRPLHVLGVFQTPEGLERTIDGLLVLSRLCSGHHQLPTREPLIERDDRQRGCRLDALPPEELEPLFVGALRVTDEDARFLGGESLGEALDRIHPALDRLVAREWNTALAVFHGGVNRIIISYALSGDRTYFGTFEQAPACINVLDLGDDGWVVRTVNYVPYDPLHPARTTTMEHLWEELRGYFDR